jgi:hypothetical protein
LEIKHKRVGILNALARSVQSLAVALALCLLVGADLPGNGRRVILNGDSRLQWVDTNGVGVSAHFVVLVYSGNKLIHSERVDAPAVKMKVLLGKTAPGEYLLRIVTIDQAGRASAPSPPLLVTWIGEGVG